jgi:polyphosphate kinase
VSELISKIWRRLPPNRRKPTPVSSTIPGIDTTIAGDPPVEPDGARYNNREISDLQSIERVLEEAHNTRHPLLERLRFLAISSTILDQFYSGRVAKLRRSAARQDAYMTPDGLTPRQQLTRVMQHGLQLMLEQQRTWESIHEELTRENIRLAKSSDLTVEELDWLHGYFRSHVLPVLTPCMIDEEHPFPFMPSGEVCAVLEFQQRHVLVPLPPNLLRFVPLPGDEPRFFLLEDMIFRFWPDLFPNDVLQSHGVFQLLRDNDLARQERSDDLRAMVESGLRVRHKANVILLKVGNTMSESSISFIAGHLEMFTKQELMMFEAQQRKLSDSHFIYATPMPGLGDLADVIPDEASEARQHLLFEPYVPREPRDLESFSGNIFEKIAEKDLLVHWPYESFDSTAQFLDQAAEDPDVLSIKQTVYRTTDDSPIVNSLISAARAGKAVTTVIELEARENESSNVQLAKRLEAAGVQIIYGIIGLKIHNKATLIVRREDDDTATYSHICTGNYHPVNARLYTDLSFFTRDPVIGEDINQVFNYISSGSPTPTKKLIMAPTQLRQKLYEMIDNEIALARSGRPAHIYIKVNSLTDPHIIERLYTASESGVEVDLIIRRECTLKPGIEGMSSRIRVKSIMGRFLEHSRIYLFSNGGEPEGLQSHLYIGSPDLMERNLDERCEILAPIDDEDLRRRIINQVMHANILDSKQSWLLTDGTYERHPDRDGFSAQEYFQQREPEDLGKLNTTNC